MLRTARNSGSLKGTKDSTWVSQLLGTDPNVYVLFVASQQLGLLLLQNENQKFRCGR